MKAVQLCVGVASICLFPDIVVAAGFSDASARQDYVTAARARSRARKTAAADWARAQNVPVRYSFDGTTFELMALDNGRPLYYKTHNANAAISTAADKVRNTPPYNVNGSLTRVGVWDAGAVLAAHQEFGGRVIVSNPVPAHNHATHVCGTVGAAGVFPGTAGMAPGATVESYDWNDDEPEMASRGAAESNDATRVRLSNHSYGFVSGWEWGAWSGTSAWHWLWDIALTNEPLFGQYSQYAREWDAVAYGAPYYLIVKSAGNDRSDNPANGDAIVYTPDDGSTWIQTVYSNDVHAGGDGAYKGGYDSVPTKGCAKNILTVGAVHDAVYDNARSLAAATMSSFSSWGPADDGRVKPDVVGNGVSLFSPIANDTNDYGSYSGTSMAAPNVMGSAVLLSDYYSSLFGAYPRASMLKALIIHTADDLGIPGPDYTTGWGLMNTKTAADVLTKANSGCASCIKFVEGSVCPTNPTAVYGIYSGDALPLLKVTLCWTDPPGTATSNHDDRTAALVNDLDLRVITPDGRTNYPYVLDGARPAESATRGDNSIDNVEQVTVASGGQPGAYTIIVSHKGVLTNCQHFALIATSVGDPRQVFVAEYGNDGNSGANWVDAWRSLSNALRRVAPYVTVHLGSGVWEMAENWTGAGIHGDGGTGMIIQTEGVNVVGRSPQETVIHCGPGYGGVRLEHHNTSLRNLQVLKEGPTHGVYQKQLRGTVWVAWHMTNVNVSNVLVRCLTDSINCAGGHGAAPDAVRFTHCAFETVHGNNCVYLLAKTGIFEQCTFAGGEAAVYGSSWWLGGGAHAELRKCVLSLTNTFLYLETNTSAAVDCSVYDTMVNGVGGGEGTWQTGQLAQVAFDFYSSNALPYYSDVYGRGWRRPPDAPYITAPQYIAPGRLDLILTCDPVTVTVEKLMACDLWLNGANRGRWDARQWTCVLAPTGETNAFWCGGCGDASAMTRVIVDVPEAAVGVLTACALIALLRGAPSCAPEARSLARGARVTRPQSGRS